MELPDITTLTADDSFYVNNDGLSKAVSYPTLRDQIRAGGAGSARLGLETGQYNLMLLSLRNDSGTLKHAIFGDYTGAASQYANGLNGPSPTYQNTPTGTDSSTPFVAGVKISSAAANRILLDTANIIAATDKPALLVNITYNNTGTIVFAPISLHSDNVNGVTRNRVVIDVASAAGSAFNINTTNIPTGAFLHFTLQAFIPNYS